MPTTSDPVTPAEVGERLGLPGSDIRAWRSKGLIPDPDWTPRGSAIWAWETLSQHPRIASRLNPRKRPKGWVTIADYAKARGLSTSHVRTLLNSGCIRSAWLGPTDFDDWLLDPAADPVRPDTGAPEQRTAGPAA